MHVRTAEQRYSSMAGFVEYPVVCDEDAVQAVLEGIGLRVDPRKVLWCGYPAHDLDHEELQAKVEKNTTRLEEETEYELTISQVRYVGVPHLKLVSRGVPHLNCGIDLYYVACDNTDAACPYCWYGRLAKKADSFDCPLCLIPFLQNKGKIRANEVRVVERSPSCSTYEFMGKEWRIPDAFVGFLRALGEKRKGFEGLLDPESCLLMARFAKETPTADAAKPQAGADYQDVVVGLEGLGCTKTEANDAAKYVEDKSPQGSLEDKVREALAYVGSSQSFVRIDR